MDRYIYVKMGIYSNRCIFGIRISTHSADDFSKTLFEQKYEEPMTHTQMQEAFLFYTGWNDTPNLSFHVWVEYRSRLDPRNKCHYMIWHPITLQLFLEKFDL